MLTICEPLRRLGYDLSQAKLEAIALSLGIDKSVLSMTQAEKAQLRYYAILTQVTTAQGDMARTLESPANQLRILSAQVTQAARALGNIFIPILNKVLPYAIAFLKVTREVANAIATIAGFTLPEVDYSGLTTLTSSSEDATDSLDDTTESAKELQKTLMGFDELNVINSSSLTDTVSELTDAFDFDLPEYDFLSGLTESKISGIVEDMKEWFGITEDIDSWADLINTKFGAILTTVGLVSVGIAAWTAPAWLLGATMVISSFTLATGDLDIKGQIAASLVNVLAGAGIGAKIGGPQGALVGASIGIAISVIAVAFNTDSFNAGWDKIKSAISGNWEEFFSSENLAAEAGFTWGDFALAIFSPGLEAFIANIKSIGTRGGEEWYLGWKEYFTNLDLIAVIIDLALLSPFTFPLAIKHFTETGETLGTTLSDAIKTKWGSFVDEWKIKISDWWINDIQPWFTKERWTQLWDDAKTSISESASNCVEKARSIFSELPGEIGYAIGGVAGKISTWGTNTISSIKIEVPKIINSIVDYFSGVPSKVGEKLDSLKQTITTWKDNAIGWIETEIPKIINNIIDWFKNLPTSLVNIGINMIKGIWNGIVSMGTWFADQIKSFFGDAWSIAKDLFNGFAAGYTVSYNPIPQYATGGFPEAGEYFKAREGGMVEYVGSMGNRATVANNDQIVEGISEGVYSAVIAAMQNIGSNDSAPFIIELDGDAIYQGMVKKDKQTVKRTGQSAFAH